LHAVVPAEKDMLIVRRPARIQTAIGIIRQLLQVCSIGVHHPDLIPLIPLGSERNLLAVVRPGRICVHAIAIAEAAGLGPVGVHEKEFQMAAAAA
jgi:hypothetical protein